MHICDTQFYPQRTLGMIYKLPPWQVSQEEEETALMDGDSDSDSSLSVGVAEGGGAVKVDIDVTPETRETNSDEELINL